MSSKQSIAEPQTFGLKDEARASAWLKPQDIKDEILYRRFDAEAFQTWVDSKAAVATISAILSATMRQQHGQAYF